MLRSFGSEDKVNSSTFSKFRIRGQEGSDNSEGKPPTDTSPSPQSGIIVKEMFMHTTLKIYPNGSIYMEIKGRPKDIQYPHKEKAVKPTIDFKINKIKKEMF